MKNNTKLSLPSVDGLLPFHKKMIVVSTILAVITLSFVIEPSSMRPVFPVVFFAASFFGQNFWTPLKRLFVFVGLCAAIVLQAGGFNDGIGTSLLVSAMLMKYVEMKTKRDAAMMALFNSIAPFVAFLQDQTPVILLSGLLCVFTTLLLMQMLYTQAEKTLKKTVFFHIKYFLRSTFLVLPLVVLGYAVIPRIDNPLWNYYYKRGSIGGINEEMNVSDWGEMFSDLSTAFRVRFEGRPPPVREMYFRGITMWTFDGKKWSVNPKVPSAKLPTTLVRGVRTAPLYTYDVSYEIIDRRAYVLDYPNYIPNGYMLFSDDTFMSTTKRNLKNVKWISGGQTPSSLSPAARESALQLPSSNPQIKEWSISQRKKFSTDLEFAKFVSNYLHANYTYSLNPAAVGENAVDDFFFKTKEGFCAHFSSAFTIIMRSAGIPSRVVNGYFASELSELGDYYRVRQADAHAWSEVWIDDKWVRFDPTSSVGSSLVRNGQGLSGFFNKSYEALDWMKDAWNRYVIYYDKAAQERTIKAIKERVSLSSLRTFSRSLYQNKLQTIIVAILSILFFFLFRWIIFRKKKKSWASDVENFFENIGQPNQNISWVLRSKIYVADHPNMKDAQEFLRLVATLYNAYFDPYQKNSYRDIQKNLRLLKKYRKKKFL